jgi:acetylornithine deacetylase
MSAERLYDLQQRSVELLGQLISIPSFSKEEEETAAHIASFLEQHGVTVRRHLNNAWAVNKYFDPSKPTILLNSHHDTVRPNAGYTLDPFHPIQRDGKLYGLGSNDAGGPLVSLIAAFLYFYEKRDMKYNLVIAATAEEETSGRNGIECLLPLLPPIDCAIVGEPTKMDLAVAERGLMVLNCVATGKAGHAAREEGENALYKALEDIRALQQLHFDRSSDLLGPVKLSVTVIETENKAHNIVPAHCNFVVDVRINERYTMEEVLAEIRKAVSCAVNPRSLRLRSSAISPDHPLVKAGLALGRSTYGSPTTSDKALMPFPALKMGPGDSARSHTADEFIYIEEIHNGIDTYIQLLNQLL